MGLRFSAVNGTQLGFIVRLLDIVGRRAGHNVAGRVIELVMVRRRIGRVQRRQGAAEGREAGAVAAARVGGIAVEIV